MMKRNIGKKDRLLRFGIALALFAFAWWYASWIALLFALFTLYEAAASWCIIYQIIGKNSCSIDRRS